MKKILLCITTLCLFISCIAVVHDPYNPVNPGYFPTVKSEVEAYLMNNYKNTLISSWRLVDDPLNRVVTATYSNPYPGKHIEVRFRYDMTASEVESFKADQRRFINILNNDNNLGTSGLKDRDKLLWTYIGYSTTYGSYYTGQSGVLRSDLYYRIRCYSTYEITY